MSSDASFLHKAIRGLALKHFQFGDFAEHQLLLTNYLALAAILVVVGVIALLATVSRMAPNAFKSRAQLYRDHPELRDTVNDKLAAKEFAKLNAALAHAKMRGKKVGTP
ncbi:hypothetical protein BCR37DRAFT_397721 [Protomyces lactucae-debilis]|uniref:Uncharacterized protein n=1 Tax=Protomyces lactucae-debilis TaxID=2754530 RepID=A0A1Y2FL73_PROLT|nr:uncharacterized protein BCR37DRAFT_397721 [Protomyces lactucae-debilis]ORY84327.1 hypothetical protein BCR37DRAFT_397721 [Protomyces lactucae-debilis]